jgi:hypothetical protein
MIEIEDRFLRPGELVSLGDRLEIVAMECEASQPADVFFHGYSNELEIKGFAGQRFDKTVERLAPSCEIATWRAVQIIVGLPSVVVCTPSSLKPHTLFRSPVDDTGFYNVQWTEANDSLFCVYESGILALDTLGVVIWHRRKYWDDTFVGMNGNELTLLSERGLIVLNAITGKTE